MTAFPEFCERCGQPFSPARLSKRIREVVALVATGLSNKEIGKQLGTTELTVKCQVVKAMRVMRVNPARRVVLAAKYVTLNPIERIAYGFDEESK